MGEGKRRPIIGFMAGCYHTDHPRRMVRALNEAFSGEDVDVRYYLGTENKSFLNEFSLRENAFDYQYASLYNYAAFDGLDVLIIGLGTILSYQEKLSAQAFFSRLPKIPMIILESEEGDPDSCHILLDNQMGIRSCVDHLARERGCRDIAYLSGPVHNPEAAQRLAAFRAAMEENHLPLSEERIAYGDFSENCDELVRSLLGASPRLPEAIVSANDEMAVSIYRVAKEMGLQIGKDLLVTGFDDMEIARYMDPPLTTVRQDVVEIAGTAAQAALSILRGEKIGSRLVPTHLICRESSGTLRDEAEKKKEYVQASEQVYAMHGSQNRSHVGAMMLRELMLDFADTREFFERFAKGLCTLKTRSAYVHLLEAPAILLDGEVADPDYLRVYLRQSVQGGKDRFEVFGEEDAPKVSRAQVELWLMETEAPAQQVSFLLYYEQYQYGVFTVQITPEEIPFYSMLAVELGTGLRFMHINLSQQADQKNLRRQNEQLGHAASHDMLTGLYNRAGGYREMARQIGQNPGSRFVAVAADLDHLKQINDLFGHGEGDHAIRTAAGFLKDALETEGVVARTGGDEFIVMFRKEAGLDGDSYLERVNLRCREYNAASGKPYYVEISAGFIEFTSRKEDDLNTIYQKADYTMYLAKQARRSSVLQRDSRIEAGFRRRGDRIEETNGPGGQAADAQMAVYSQESAGRQKDAGKQESVKGEKTVQSRAGRDAKSGQTRQRAPLGERTKKDRKRKSLRDHVMTLILRGWLLPFAVFFLVMSVLIYVRLTRQMEHTALTSTERAVENLQMRLADCETSSKNASYIPTIRNAYKAYGKDQGWWTLYRATDTFLSEQYRYDDNFRASFVYFTGEIQDYCYTVNQFAGAGYADAEVFLEKALEPVLAEAENIDTATALVQVEERIYMIRNLVTERYQPFAVLAQEINQEYIFAPINNIWGQSGFRIILRDGDVVSTLYTAGDGAGQVSWEELDEKIRDGKTGEPQLLRQGRERYITEQLTIGEEELCLLLRVNRRVIYSEIGSLLLILFGMLVLLIPLMLLILRFFRRKVAEPVEQMVDAYSKIQEGRYGTRIEQRSDSSEFYYLEDAFNSMAVQLQEQFEKIYLEEINLRDAKISALQSHVSPKFMLETLDLLSREARIRQNDAAAMVLESLMTLMNAATNQDNRTNLPLREELGYVEAYLQIIGFRFGDRFRCEKEIDERLLDREVPRFIIQPAAEYAVEHAEISGGDLVLSLRVFQDVAGREDGSGKGDLIIQAEHFGRLTLEEKRHFEELFSENYTARGEDPALLGLRNIHQRIRMLCGEGCGLSISQSSEDTVSISIRVKN